MTYAPSCIKAAQVYVQARTGLAWASLGIIGDEDHRGGYHCGWDRRRLVDGELHDYAWTESSRDSGHRTDAASGLDIGEFSKGGKNLRHFNAWLIAECERGAPDTRDIREVIYSLDGETVRRWDRLRKRTTGDSSHKTHTHISYHRDAEGRDKTALFRRYFEGDDDMSWDDEIALITGQGVSYSDKKWRAGFLLASDHYYTLKYGQEIRAEQAAAKKRDEAILAKLAGADTKTILNAINARAAEDAARDAELMAEAAAAVRAALPSVEEIAQAVAAAVDHDLDTAAVEAALREVLGGVDEAAGAGE